MLQNANDAPLTGQISLGESIAPPEEKPTNDASIEQARSEEPSPAKEEKTPDNETKTPDPKDKPFVSGSKKAREAGERQKKLAKTLIDAAKESDAALQTLKATASADPMLEKYLKDTFPRDYAKLTNQQLEDEPLFDANSARVQAKAELLAEQIKMQRQEEAEDYAERLSFSVDEADQLKELALKLEGSEIGGVKLDYGQALKKAAYAIRADKAQAGAIVNIQGGIPQINTGNIQKDTDLENLASLGRRLSGRDPESIKKNLQIISENYKDGVLRIPMDLK